MWQTNTYLSHLACGQVTVAFVYQQLSSSRKLGYKYYYIVGAQTKSGVWSWHSIGKIIVYIYRYTCTYFDLHTDCSLPTNPWILLPWQAQRKVYWSVWKRWVSYPSTSATCTRPRFNHGQTGPCLNSTLWELASRGLTRIGNNLRRSVLYQGRIREKGMQLTISPTCEQKLNGRSTFPVTLLRPFSFCSWTVACPLLLYALGYIKSIRICHIDTIWFCFL